MSSPRDILLSHAYTGKCIKTSNATTGHEVVLSVDVQVAQNEPMVNAVFNRNAQVLLENDIALEKLYKAVFAQMHITEYSKKRAYSAGDFVWYTFNSKLYLLKCTVDNNTNVPAIVFTHPGDTNPADIELNASGWENKNKFLTIIDFEDIMQSMQQLVESQYQAH